MVDWEKSMEYDDNDHDFSSDARCTENVMDVYLE